jgi:hypothetical protein
MARSIKTFAHALTLSTGDRVLSVQGKPDHSLRMQVTKEGKTFTLTCAGDVVTVKSQEHGGAGSVRDIADQLCERLAARSGATAAEMSIGEGPARARVALNLEASSGKRASK